MYLLKDRKKSFRFSRSAIRNLTEFLIKTGKEIRLSDYSKSCYLELTDREPDPVEMTIEEVEKKLGKKIKIVSKKN